MNDDSPAAERVNYFFGQQISVADLQAEQDYFLDKSRRHNRFVHGWGVASGLKVKVDMDASGVVVEPGIAIDCAGNELHVCTRTRLALPPSTGPAPNYYVVVRYTETPASPVPTASPATEPVFSRIREGCEVELVTVDPSSHHAGRGAGTAGCGSPHAVCIARLAKGATHWTAAARGRVRR